MDLKPEGKVQIRTDFSLYAMNLACLVSAAHCRTRRALIHHESPLLSYSLQKLDVTRVPLFFLKNHYAYWIMSMATA